eukprot:3813365-Rhodomonas_salina.4
MMYGTDVAEVGSFCEARCGPDKAFVGTGRRLWSHAMRGTDLLGVQLYLGSGYGSAGRELLLFALRFPTGGLHAMLLCDVRN